MAMTRSKRMTEASRAAGSGVGLGGAAGESSQEFIGAGVFKLTFFRRG